MQRLYQWIRDKKTNTIRKWRSAIVSIGSRRSSNARESNDLADEATTEKIYHSELDVPTEGGHLRPIGGSECVLCRPSEKETSPFVTTPLTPILSRKQNGGSHLLVQYCDAIGQAEYDNEVISLADEGRPKTVTDGAPVCDAHVPSPSFSKKHLENAPYQCCNDIDEVEDWLDVDDGASTSYASGRPLLSPSPGLSLPTGIRRSSASMPLSRQRRLRFAIPQVSVSSADGPPDSQPVTLIKGFPADQPSTSIINEQQTPDSSKRCRKKISMNNSTLSAPASPAVRFSSSPDIDNPMAVTRRAISDIERRRMSLAQRRQSNVQLAQSCSGRRASTTLIPLTLAQIHLVRSLWRQMYLSKGPTVIGQTIIHRLFFKLPKTKDQFRRCPLPRNFPNHDSFAKAHAKAMADIVDKVVENLDNLETISAELEQIGRVHAQIMRGELSSKLWNTVAETFIDCTLEWGDKRCRTETVRKAWALIIAFMVERIKSGHHEQRKHMLTMRTTVASIKRIQLDEPVMVNRS